MVLRSVGPVLISILMRGERSEEPASDWLLHGPSDPRVVEATEATSPEIPLMAAE